MTVDQQAKQAPTVWVDADACPVPVREIIERSALRREVLTVFVANHVVRLQRSPLLVMRVVEAGFDVADNAIAQDAKVGDLVITQDIPLAAELVAMGVQAMNPRGTLYTPDNVRSHLARRDRAEEMRAIGVQTRGPAPLGKADVQSFANSFDRVMTAICRRQG